MTMAAVKQVNVNVKTDAQMKELMNYEAGRFYMAVGGQAVSINQKFIFTKSEVDDQSSMLIREFQHIMKNPQSPEESEEANDMLKTLTILPFRIH